MTGNAVALVTQQQSYHARRSPRGVARRCDHGHVPDRREPDVERVVDVEEVVGDDEAAERAVIATSLRYQ